ncbi:MAG: GGDEF domain-containing protein [Myxococcales bacterium]|nr:GGDEF domain-containing protein [Myxococcales bacterium]MCB9648914.1 GGDEF domain-containing protein [Deltaproteobacteria bacterium]
MRARLALRRAAELAGSAPLRMALATIGFAGFVVAYQGHLEEASLAELDRDAGVLVARASLLLEHQVTADATNACILRSLIEGSEAPTYPALAHDLLQIASIQPAYDQIRFLDTEGHERVRVNAGRDRAWLVPEAQLQDKSGRSYMRDLAALARDQLYFSRLDLNVEHGQVELPYKPVLRTGVDLAWGGERQGYLVINHLMAPTLERIRGLSGRLRVQLVDQSGYWILAETPELEFGQLVEGRSEARMSAWVPDAWVAMQRNQEGSSTTREGRFVFRRFQAAIRSGCAATSRESGSFDPGWWLVVRVHPQQVMQVRQEALEAAVSLWAPIYLAVLLVLAMLSRHRSIKLRYQQRLEAMVRQDALTGLATRTVLEAALQSELQRSRRHHRRFGLLYLDLDGFKAINDGFGHAAGDQILRHVAAILHAEIRETDVATRLGGDEFLVLLSELPERSALHRAAERILGRVQGLDWEGLPVGASIGLALWPDDLPHGGASELVHVADQYMYQAKARGKNQICGRLQALPTPAEEVASSA